MSTNLVIHSEDAAIVIPALLSHLETLNDRGPERAAQLREAYAETISILVDHEEPPEGWDRDQAIEELLSVLVCETNAFIPEDNLLRGRYFGQRGRGEWGWWDDPGIPQPEPVS